MVLQVIDIVSHPDFKAEAGVEGGKDIAVFKVGEASLEDISSKDINPVCFQEPNRPALKEGIHSGWSTPPILHYFREFGEAFLPFVADTFNYTTSSPLMRSVETQPGHKFLVLIEFAICLPCLSIQIVFWAAGAKTTKS